MSEVTRGSCVCGGIKFEHSAKPFAFSLCHCGMCQKFSGSNHGAFIGVKKADFKYTHGEDLVKVFPSSEWASRAFCKNCGSSLMYIYHEMEDSHFVSAGLFDDDPGIKPSRHIFVKDKCSWLNIHDDLPQLETYK